MKVKDILKMMVGELEIYCSNPRYENGEKCLYETLFEGNFKDVPFPLHDMEVCFIAPASYHSIAIKVVKGVENNVE